MLTSIPLDNLIIVSDFGGSHILSHTCRHTWQALQRRHAHYHVTVCNAAKIVNALQDPAIPLTLRSNSVVLQVKQSRNVSRHLEYRLHRHLMQLTDAPLRYTVSLDIHCMKWNASSAECLGVLRHVNSLQILALNVFADGSRPGEGAGPTEVQALAGLNGMATLYKLNLNLRNNRLRDASAQALAGLKYAACLHTLSIDLTHNNVGDLGAKALVELKDAPCLNTLSLNLSRNCVGNPGIMALRRLGNLTHLRTLRIVIMGVMWIERTVVPRPWQG
jgi:hypothetical protein